MNWDLVLTESNIRRLLIGNFPDALGGLMLTLIIGFLGIVASTVLGTTVGVMRSSKRRRLRLPAVLYVETLRNVPVIILVFWAYFVPPYLGFRISGFWSVTLALTIFNAAYIAEIVRAGISTVPAGQVEAARVLGLGRWKILAYVTLPQAFFNMLPALTNRYVTLIKNTSLAFLIGLADLTEIGRQINNRLLTAPVEIYGLLLLIYFISNKIFSLLIGLLEDRARFNRIVMRVI